MGNTHGETDVFLEQWTRDEALSFLGMKQELPKVKGLRGMRLNNASIAKIENVNPRLQVKYLSN